MYIDSSALSFILDEMTLHRMDISLSDTRWTLSENFEFLDFCTSFLFRCGYQVFFDESSLKYKLIG